MRARVVRGALDFHNMFVGLSRPFNGEALSQLARKQMAWKAPQIVEVAVGMEINMYACAKRK